MQIKNLSDEETESLLVLAGRIAMGNTEFDELSKQASAVLDAMEQRRTRLADALREFDRAAQEVNDAWDACTQFRLGRSRPEWFPSFDELAGSIHYWVDCNLADVDPNHVEAPDPEDAKPPIIVDDLPF